MFDLSQWVPQSDSDSRELQVGQTSSIKFVLANLDVFALIAFLFKNNDDVSHDVQLDMFFDGGSSAFMKTGVGAGTSRLLYPIRTFASAGGPNFESRGSMVFIGPATIIFNNTTAANTIHTPTFESRWLQSKSSLQSNQSIITRVIS